MNISDNDAEMLAVVGLPDAPGLEKFWCDVLSGGTGGTGYGTVILKRLQDTTGDDHVYAVIGAGGVDAVVPPYAVQFETSARGLLTAILSVYHAVLPPCAANSRPRPWIVPGYDAQHAYKRTAVLLEPAHPPVFIYEYADSTPRRLLTPRDSEIFILQAANQDQLLHKLRAWINYIESNPVPAPANLAYTMSLEAVRRETTGSEAISSEAAPPVVRLAVVAASVSELAQKLQQIEDIAAAGGASIFGAGVLTSRAFAAGALPSGVFYGAAHTASEDTPKLAFMLPGLGAAYPDMLLDLCLHYPEVREVFDYVDGLALAEGEKTLPSKLLFPNISTAGGGGTVGSGSTSGGDHSSAAGGGTAGGATDDIGNLAGTAMLAIMDSAVVTVLLAEWAIYMLLDKFGIKPDALVGCSTGEFAALTMGGVADIAGAARMFYRLSVSVARSLPRERLLNLASMKVNAAIESIEMILNRLRTAAAMPATAMPAAAMPATAMPAATTPTDTTPTAIAPAATTPGAHDPVHADYPLYVTAEFTHRHSIVTGSRQAISQAAELLKKSGIEFHHLPVAIPYHTPLVEGAVSAQHDEVVQLPLSAPAIPIWSCAAAATYGSDIEAMRRTTTELFAHTILFERTIKAARASGINTFVEVGPRNNLTSFAREIFNMQDSVAILPSDVMGRNSLTQLNYLLAQLFCRGCDVKFDALFEHRQVERINLAAPPMVPPLLPVTSAPPMVPPPVPPMVPPPVPAAREQIMISYLEGIESLHRQVMQVEAAVFNRYLQTGSAAGDRNDIYTSAATAHSTCANTVADLTGARIFRGFAGIEPAVSIACVDQSLLNWADLSSIETLAATILGQSEQEAWKQQGADLKRRVHWLMGRAAAKKAIMEITKTCDPCAVEILNDEAGWPYCAGGVAAADRLHVSIAHTDGLAVATAVCTATAGGAPAPASPASASPAPSASAPLASSLRAICGIGVDVERANRYHDGRDFPKMAFSDQELQQIKQATGLPQSHTLSPQVLTRIWTAKEALGKAARLGLGQILKQCRFVDCSKDLSTIKLCLTHTPPPAPPVTVHTVAEQNFYIASALLIQQPTNIRPELISLA